MCLNAELCHVYNAEQLHIGLYNTFIFRLGDIISVQLLLPKMHANKMSSGSEIPT